MPERSTVEQDDAEVDETPYFSYSATLRIFGTIPDLDEITRNLGIPPTHFHRRGDRRSELHAGYEHDMWSYRAPVDRAMPLHTHIDTLWEMIRGRTRYLLSLKSGDLTVDVFLGYRSSSDTAGVEIPYQSLEIFRELQVPFGLSIIVA